MNPATRHARAAFRQGTRVAEDNVPDHPPARVFRDLRGTNQTAMRASNERIVLSLLRERGALPKAEIARLSGLSAQTVSVIMRALEDDELLLRGDPVRGKVGQPSIPMSLNPNGAFFFGLKVGRRSADLVLVDFLGRPLHHRRRTYGFPTPDETIAFVKNSIANVINEDNRDIADRVGGLGIAIPGYLWEWAGTIGEPQERMSQWRDRDISQEIGELVEFPVYTQNDASSACRAELVFGTSSHPSDFLYFYIGYFVGGGLVLNNGLFTGQTGNAGALGPILVPSEDGALRQLVDVASLSGLERRISAAGRDGSIIWEEPATWDLPDDQTGPWLDQAAEGLAHAIAASCSVIDFKLVFIEGWLPPALRTALVSRTREQLAKLDTVGLIAPEIREGTIGPHARALGAAGLPLSKRFLIETGAHSSH